MRDMFLLGSASPTSSNLEAVLMQTNLKQLRLRERHFEVLSSNPSSVRSSDMSRSLLDAVF